MFGKNRKIVFVETNASVGMGHHITNVENIPVSSIRENIPFTMVTERSVKGKHYVPLFTPIKEIEDTGVNKGVELRISDYRTFLEKFSKNICFVLSNYSKDLYAWMEVLSDKKYQRIIKQNNTLLIIHAVVFYPLFFENKKIIKQILKDLDGYVFFSFFTKEIAETAKKIYSSKGFLGMIHPVYNEIYAFGQKNDYLKKYDFTFWLGGGENLESHIVEFLQEAGKRLNRFKSAVRIAPIRDHNYLLVNHLNNHPDVELYDKKMSSSVCMDLFSRSKIGIMPYDDFEGSVKASGVFENFMLLGVPVLVPKKTWMYEILKSLGSPGLGFEAGNIADFNDKLLCLYENYESFSIKAKIASKKLFDKLNMRSFADTVFELDEKRAHMNLNFYGNNVSKYRIAEGYSYFKGLYFESLNSFRSAGRLKNDMKKDARKYYKLRFSLLKKNIFDKRDLNYFFKNIKRYNPSAVSKVIATFNADILTDKQYQRTLLNFVDNSYYYFPVSVLNAISEYGLVSSRVKKALQGNVFYQAEALNINVLLADLLSSVGLDEKAFSVRKQLFAKMSKRPRKTILETYTLASICLKLDFLNEAASLYNKILNLDKSEDNLKGSSSFHLGCISLKMKEELKALSYFRKTLEFIPLHNKAKQYIQTLEEK